MASPLSPRQAARDVCSQVRGKGEANAAMPLPGAAGLKGELGGHLPFQPPL